MKWTDDPKSPLKLKPDDIEKQSGKSLYQYAKEVPAMKAPAIWFPHTIHGISTSDILIDDTGNNFGPFDGQMFVGDQGHSKIMRVFMEKINGVYQGATFPFKDGFSSGILRMIWGSDASMFVGMTSRGWASTGKENFGLQRLVWTGKAPFEMKTIKAQEDGFELEFTKPVDKNLGSKVSNYSITTFTYHYHNTYGSPVVDQQNGKIQKAEVSADGLKVKLIVHGMKLGYIHQVKLGDLLSRSGDALLHDVGYYTLNEVPGGVLKSPEVPAIVKPGGNAVQPKRTTEMPVTWLDGPDRNIEIGTKPGLLYDIDELTVQRGSKVKLTFNNNDDMLHNLVIVKQGEDTADKVGEMAIDLGIDGTNLNYVPDSELVLYHTGILQPGRIRVNICSSSLASWRILDCVYIPRAFKDNAD